MQMVDFDLIYEFSKMAKKIQGIRGVLEIEKLNKFQVAWIDQKEHRTET